MKITKEILQINGYRQAVYGNDPSAIVYANYDTGIVLMQKSIEGDSITLVPTSDTLGDEISTESQLLGLINNQ